MAKNKRKTPPPDHQRKAEPDHSQEPTPDAGVIIRAFAASGDDAIRRLRAEDEEAGAPARYEVRLTTADPVHIGPDYHETLGHEAGEVRMDWLNSGNAPLLWMHRHEEQLGVIEGAAVREGSIFITLRFGPSPLAQEKQRDVEADILRNVSVGFRIHGWRFEEETDEGDFYRVTDWEPKEASFVTVPADPNTGLGRSASEKCHLQEIEQFRTERTNNITTSTMAKPGDNNQAPEGATLPEGAQRSAGTVTIEREPAPDNRRAIQDAVAQDRDRQRKLRDIGDRWNFSDEAERACDEGTSIADFNSMVLEKGQTRSLGTSTDEIGLSPKEKKRYSIANVVRALTTGNTRAAEFELDVSDTLKEAQGRSNDRFALPTDVLMRGWVPQDSGLRSMMYGERALVGVTAGNAEAADLVETELRDSMFIESLREHGVLLSQGVTVLPGLVGEVDIPRELTNPEFYWVAEDVEPTDGDYTLDNVQLRFKTVAGRISFTRQAGKTSTPGIEGLLTNSIRKGVANAVENALINGTGASGQPTGILATSGIGSVTTSGTLTRDLLLSFEQALGDANADTSNSIGLTNTRGKAVMLTTKTDTGSGLFVGTRTSNSENAVDTDIGRFHISNLVPRNLGAGTDKSAIIYGNAAGLNVGMWGGVEMMRDVSTKAATGGVVLRVFQDLDCVVSRPAEWAVATDLT